MWHVVIKLEYVFGQERYDTTFEFEWTREKSQATIILGKFVNKS